MGRNYYCEYCDKRFKDDANIREKHINGLAHQTARREHYAKYKDPKTILEEELQKKRCTWFQSGYCQYGSACRFSHATPEQLEELHQKAAQIEYNEWLKSQPKQYSEELIHNFMANRRQKQQDQLQGKLQQFFDYPEQLLTKQQELPPSLRLLQPNEVKTTESNEEWSL